VTVLEKAVCFAPGEEPQVYHSVTQSAYVAIFALTDAGRIPIVSQYRPAVETYTWEFPAGTVDAGEDPQRAAVRELMEETGLRVETIAELGPYHPDTGRLSVASTAYFARCHGPDATHASEAGIIVRYVTLRELFNMVRTGEFKHQLHLALIASALVRGHIALPDSRYNHGSIG
jgi:ADP-ribose pyrophosphatase